MSLFNPPVYNINAWFFTVQNQSPSTQVWSTAANAYVPLTDAGYQAFLANGNITTVYDTDTDLSAYLIAQGVKPPVNPSVISALDFHNRFTPTESMTITEAALSNATIMGFYLFAAMAGSINLANSVVTEGVGMLASAGLITTDRATQILTP